MKKKNIVPMPATEEGRRRIQQKLSRQRSLGGNQRNEDFFSRRKEAFIQKMIEMGMEYTDLADFLDDKSIHEENPELILDFLNDPSYVNPLKVNFIQAPNAHAQLQAQGYGYQPDPRQQQAAAKGGRRMQAPQQQ